MRTDEPGQVVAGLVADGGEPVGLEVIRPSLEDVYLDLVRGHRMEDNEVTSPDDNTRGSIAGDSEEEVLA